jgi:hypothetical protein
LLARISQFAKPLCEAAGISYKQETDENLGNYNWVKKKKETCNDH